MSTVTLAHPGRAALAATFAAGALIVVPVAPAAAYCHTAAQTITKRQNISCKNAKKVANEATRPFLRTAPECRGDRGFSWRGWRFQGVATQGQIIEAKVSKGNRSFHLGGGGVC